MERQKILGGSSRNGNLTRYTKAFASITGTPAATLIRDDVSMAKKDQSHFAIHVVPRPEARSFRISAMTSNSSHWAFGMINFTEYNSIVGKRSEGFIIETSTMTEVRLVSTLKGRNVVNFLLNDWHQIIDGVLCYLGDISGSV